MTESGCLPSRGAIGKWAEKSAEQYLCRQGLTLITRNFRCKLGEIDLVMNDNEVVVFVEVRYRSSTKFASPVETITETKRRKLVRAASVYLQNSYRSFEPPCRFDVIGLSGPPETAVVNWIKGAFTA